MSGREHSRRDVLRKGSLAGAAVVAGGALVATGAAVTQASAGTTPAERGRNRDGVTTIVFVSGANGGTGGDNTLSLLGHRTVGVELPGHSPDAGQFRRAYQAPQDLDALATAPSPVAGVTLDDYAERAIEVVRTVAAHGPVILFGGSMGGITLNRVGNAVPELIDLMVYAAAFCPVTLPSAAAYLQTPEGRDTQLGALVGAAIGDPEKLGASRMNWRTADPDFLAKAKDALMAGASDAEFLAMLNTLVPDEALDPPVADARVQADTWGRIPRVYIRHTRDRCIPPALQSRFIREADELTRRQGTRFTVYDVPTSHYAYGPGYQQVVRILHRLASR